jgi:hypothetical protein
MSILQSGKPSPITTYDFEIRIVKGGEVYPKKSMQMTEFFSVSSSSMPFVKPQELDKNMYGSKVYGRCIEQRYGEWSFDVLETDRFDFLESMVGYKNVKGGASPLSANLLYGNNNERFDVQIKLNSSSSSFAGSMVQDAVVSNIYNVSQVGKSAYSIVLKNCYLKTIDNIALKNDAQRTPLTYKVTIRYNNIEPFRLG